MTLREVWDHLELRHKERLAQRERSMDAEALDDWGLYMQAREKVEGEQDASRD